MKNEGPSLEALTHRLSECPPEFLLPPRVEGKGEIAVHAVVADTLRSLGMPDVRPVDVVGYADKNLRKPNTLSIILITCHLLHDEWFRTQGKFAPAAITFFDTDADLLGNVVNAQTLVTDPDRREELVRLVLKSLNLRPEAETPAQAQDRLSTLSSVERERILKETRKAEERARQIREAMAKKAADEAANKYTRE